MLFRLVSFDFFLLLILHLSYFLGGQQMSATPISTDYVRDRVLFRSIKNSKGAQLNSIEPLKYKKQLEETQITMKLTKYGCCHKLTVVFRKINAGLNIIQNAHSL